MTRVKRKNGLKEILVSSVAVMGLSVGVAEGQEVGLQGMMEGGKYGGGARVYMPFGGISSGSVFLGLNGGMVGGKMKGSGVLGYGKGFGEWGVRGYVG
ncbi:MAG: hypothetical protein JNK86_06955, partial [Alphaproteobacteria bacterium]|nr:hypothetical protein [Alphaproteobacteria bacterium]